MKELENLVAQVAAQTTVVESAITLIQGLAGKVDSAGVDPQKLADLSVQLKTQADSLAAAVAANTPQATAQPATADTTAATTEATPAATEATPADAGQAASQA